jgi:hypothetical protein
MYYAIGNYGQANQEPIETTLIYAEAEEEAYDNREVYDTVGVYTFNDNEEVDVVFELNREVV